MNVKNNCAIIGFGNWGKKISEAVYESNRFEIKYIYDKQYIDKSFHKIQKSNNINDIVKDKNINTIFIFTPNNLHGYYIKMFANNKKNIFVEKPICNTSKEALDVLDECKKNNCKLMVGHNVKYYSIFRKSKNIVEKNLIGDVYHVEMNRSRPIWKTIDKDSWRFSKKTCNGGPLIQMGLHMIDTVNYLIGFSIEDVKTIGTNNYLKSENHETYDIIGTTKDGVTFYLYSSYLPAETFYINIYGSKGTLFIDVNRGVFFQKINEFKSKKITYKKNNPELDEIIDFYNMIQSENYDYSNVERAIEDVVDVEKILDV